MITAQQFVNGLKARGIREFTGVPCSFFQAAITCVLSDPELRYTMVPNEGAALALAAGTYLAGQRTAVMIQSSGVGNLINPLTSLSMIYRLPALLLISGRAYGIADEPQHAVMGKAMGPMLDVIGIRHMDLPMDIASLEAALEDAMRWLEREKLPVAFFIRKGTFASEVDREARPVKYPLKRIEAIRIVAETLEGSEFVIATTGKPSRELCSVLDRHENFYMQGSMGHAAAIGLGVALQHPSKKVVILDGDGALLMHMGILSSIGHYQPRNLYHVVLDNESYESTGDQDTTSATTDFCLVARSCGYRMAEEAATEQEARNTFSRVLRGEGPAFLRIRINRLATPGIPRITTKHTAEQIAESFRAHLAHRVA